MNLHLTRAESQIDGIFGGVACEDSSFSLHTLEHAYCQPDGTFAPKLPVGTYTCKRGLHRLHGVTEDFETFEITGVEGHTHILFHWGNWNDDSEGCVLLGTGLWGSLKGKMVTNSRVAFQQFMSAQVGCDEFTLIVS